MSSRLVFLTLVPFSVAAAAAQPTPIPIEALVAEIAAGHPELRQFEAEVAAVGAEARAIAPPPPELSVELGRKRVRAAGGELAGEGAVWSVSLAQTFVWPGRLALRKAVAQRDVALAEAGLGRFRAELAARSRELAQGLHAAALKADAVREVADRYAALKETLLAREPGGLTPELELRAIEAQDLALQRRATAAELELQAALLELNQLRGAAPDTPLLLAPVSPVFGDAPELVALLDAARENNFEFRARRLELERQGFAVRLARHERYPDVTVGPFYTREGGDGRETTVGLGLSLPLPITRAPRAGIEAAEARRLQAEAAVRAAQRELEREVALAAQTFAAKVAEIRRWSPGTVAKFREAAAAADRHYRLGAVPLGTYLELQDAYLEAIEALLDTQSEALAAGLRLQLLTGLDFGAVRLAP
ncbi:MAG TPA: TolC family protein [Opitutaceae bacterium]|nr:TolC family protein [Opitutaceae bacterium]